MIRRLLAGEKVDVQGEVVRFNGGRLDFAPPRANIPIYVASNVPLGQRTAGAAANGAIMEGCGNRTEARAFAAAVAAEQPKRGGTRGPSSSWRD